MSNSFLYRLLTYAPRPNRTPWEDFFTEALVGVLGADLHLLKEIIAGGVASGRLRDGFRPPVGEEVRITTQFVLPTRSRPDMALLVNDEPVLLVENKMGADFTLRDDEEGSEEQVPHYVEQARCNWPGCKVLLISQIPREVGDCDPGIYIGNLLWSDVYGALEASEDSGRVRTDVLKQELLRLMEELKMTPPRPFAFKDSDICWEYFERKGAMQTLLSEVVPPLYKQYGLKKTGASKGDLYAMHTVMASDQSLGLGLIFASQSVKDGPVYPYLYIYQGPREAEFQAVLGASDIIPGWPGKVIYPEEEQLKSFNKADDWAGQRELATQIWDGWLKKLRDEGLL